MEMVGTWPLVSFLSPSPPDKTMYMLLCIVYIMVGMTATTTIIEIIRYVRSLGRNGEEWMTKMEGIMEEIRSEKLPLVLAGSKWRRVRGKCRS